jgi:hypothetical protein
LAALLDAFCNPTPQRIAVIRRFGGLLRAAACYNHRLIRVASRGYATFFRLAALFDAFGNPTPQRIAVIRRFGGLLRAGTDRFGLLSTDDALADMVGDDSRNMCVRLAFDTPNRRFIVKRRERLSPNFSRKAAAGHTVH